jgi:hypothetical protein
MNCLRLMPYVHNKLLYAYADSYRMNSTSFIVNFARQDRPSFGVA